jgi:hypothetical protein
MPIAFLFCPGLFSGLFQDVLMYKL